MWPYSAVGEIEKITVMTHAAKNVCKSELAARLQQHIASSSPTRNGVVLHEVLDELLFGCGLDGKQQSTVATTSQNGLSHRYWIREHQVTRSDTIGARQETLRTQSCHVVFC